MTCRDCPSRSATEATYLQDKSITSVDKAQQRPELPKAPAPTVVRENWFGHK